MTDPLLWTTEQVAAFLTTDPDRPMSAATARSHLRRHGLTPASHRSVQGGGTAAMWDADRVQALPRRGRGRPSKAE